MAASHLLNQSIQIDSDTESDQDLPSPPLSVRKPSTEGNLRSHSPHAIRSPPSTISSKKRKISNTIDKENIQPVSIVPVSSPKSDDDRITDSQIKQSPGPAFQISGIKFDNSQISFSSSQVKTFDGVLSTPENDRTWRPAKNKLSSQSQTDVAISISKTKPTTSVDHIFQTPDRRGRFRLPSTPFEDLDVDFEALIALDAIEAIEADPIPPEIDTIVAVPIPVQPLLQNANYRHSPPTSPLEGFIPLKSTDINDPRLAGFFNQFGDDGPPTSLEDQDDMVEAWTQPSQRRTAPRKNSSRGRPYHKRGYHRKR